ncbi:MAG TPA: cytochrome c peroxidase [Caldimonas sp.]|jgi:cytochrome c peroxidase|nr:cytochrome c peroxidase [Caldimonas sp.]HEX4235594.1 cytochrome c peroxidase [Caldimonas sp.]
MRWRPVGGAVVALALVAATGLSLPTEPKPWRDDELAIVAAFGPWPVPTTRDGSNRVSGRAEAAALGEALFHSTRLSTVGGLRCATCHEPWRNFTDGRARALGAAGGARNTPSLLDVRLQHWFGWDGANDSLWSQSIRPMLDAREMRSDAAHVAEALRDDETLTRLYAQAFGHAPPADNEAALVDAGKALAAYQETLSSDRTPFDDFRDALAHGDAAAAGRYPVAAQRGLRLFIGRGECIACHAAPNFSDGEFHPSRIASTLPDGAPDSGRALGVEKLLASPYTRSGRFNDGSAATKLVLRPAQAGAFRTPGLREVSTTAPYMHDGSIANLCDALEPHAALERRPTPGLTLAERRDVVAFLRTLSTDKHALLIDEGAMTCR